MNKSVKYCGAFMLLLFSCPLTFAQINNVGDLHEQMAVPTLSYEDIVKQGDSLYESDTSLEMGRKAYYRWKYRTDGRTSFPGITPTSTASDLAAYLSGSDYYTFCNTGPSESPWTEVGPDPQPGMKQAIGLISCVAADPNQHNTIYAGTVESGLWKTTNGGASWVNIIENSNLGTLAGLGFSYIAIDPNNSNNLLVGTQTHAFEMPSPWAATSNGFGILKSTDAGQTWTVGTCSTVSDQHWFVKRVRYHPTNSNIAIAVGNKTIYKTIDGGSSWTEVFTNTTAWNSVFIDVEFNLNAPNYVMASTKFTQVGYDTVSPHAAQVFGSNLGGNTGTWTEVTPPITQTDTSWAASLPLDVSPADPGYTYMLFSNFNGKKSNGQYRKTEHIFLYKTADAGQTWIKITDTLRRADTSTLANLNYGAVQHEFELSDVDPSVMYIGGFYVARSDNDGAFFDKTTHSYYPNQYTHADIRDIYNLGHINGEDHLLIANDGGVSKTVNSAETYSNLNGTGLGVSQFYGFDVYRSSDTEHLIGGAIHNGVSIKKDGNWNLFKHRGDGDWAEIDHLSEGGDVAYVVINGGVRKVVNGGLSQIGIAKQRAIRDMYRGQKLYIDPIHHRYVYHLIHNLYKYDQENDSWSLEFTKPSWAKGGDEITAFAPCPVDSDVYYVAYNNISYGAPVSGKFFRVHTSSPGYIEDLTPKITFGPGAGSIYQWTYISDIVVDPNNKRRLFVSVKNYSKDASDPTKGTFRVFYSADRGESWTDMSNGLKPIPVNDLEYIPGPDDALFAGTDGGVYRWNKNNGIWECFNNGLPNAMITQLRHDPCSRTLYASTLGRGIWKAPVTEISRPQVFIYEDEVWEHDRYISGDLIVDVSTDVTIKAKLHMGHDSRIIIKQGATLTIEDGGVITSGNCNENWSGIWMEGRSDYPQELAHQCKLILKPGAVIEYAEQAITNSAVPSGNDWVVWGTQGGIIEAEGAIFRNNTRDLALVSYKPSGNNGVYKATFKDCDFIRNNDYRNPSLMAHVSMLDVEGVQFEGCLFTDSITSGPFAQNCEGIYALNSSFTVNPSASRNSVFYGHRDAVRALNVNGATVVNPIAINYTTFTNNHHSIYISASDFAKVSHNTITVPNNLPRSAQNPQAFQPVRYGIYMDGARHFEVYENTLSTGGQNGSIESSGMIFKNSGAVATEVYRNRVDGFTVGVEAIGRNRDAGNTKVGLTLKCNDLGYEAGNGYDVFVAQAASHPENGIQVFQGENTVGTTSEDLPNNLFTPNGTPFSSNFQNEENSSVVYYYGTGNPRLDPRQVIGITDLPLPAQVDYNTDCDVRPAGPPGGLSGPSQGYAQAETDLGNVLSLRTQYLDGGATPALEAQILIADEQEEYQDLYIELMGMAPYVSDENLLNLAHIDDYPELALRNILLANPHASRNPDIMEVLYHKEPPLAAQTLADIEAGEQSITSKDVLDMQIASAQTRSEAATREILAWYRTHSEGKLNDLTEHLLQRDEPQFHYAAVDAFLRAGELEIAQDILENLPEVCVMTEDASAEYEQMEALYSLLFDLYPSSGEPDPGIIGDLENLAMADDGPAAARARNLLVQYGEPTDYTEPVYIPGSSGKKASDPQPERPLKPESGFSLSPNPAGDHVVLQWDWLAAGLSETLTIQVFDLKGSLVVQEKAIATDNVKMISLHGLKAGTYSIQVFHRGESVYTEKLRIE